LIHNCLFSLWNFYSPDIVVHFKIARHGAAVIDQSKTLYSIHNGEDLLRKSWGAKDDKNGIGELLQSPFPLRQDFSCIAPCSNGFVDTVVKAYSMHCGQEHVRLWIRCGKYSKPRDAIGQLQYYLHNNQV